MSSRRLVVPARGEILYAASDWADSLLVVESGAIELESRHGVRRIFGPGSVMALKELHLRALRNPGRRPAVLIATSR